MSIPIRRPLVLDSLEFRTRADNVAALLAVPDVQKRFFDDPAGTTAAEFGLAVDTATLSRSNRLTYALLADPAFTSWAAEFQSRVDAVLPRTSDGGPSLAEITAAKEQLQEEFRASVQAHLAPENAAVLQNIHGVQLAAEDDIAILLLVFLIILVVAVDTPQEAAISRKTVQDLLRQLDQDQIEQIRAGRDSLE